MNNRTDVERIKTTAESLHAKTNSPQRSSCPHKNHATKRQYDRQVKDLAAQNRQESLSQFNCWLKYEVISNLLVFLVIVLLLTVLGSTLFLVAKFWSLFFVFLGKMVNQFGFLYVIKVMMIGVVISFLLSLIDSVYKTLFPGRRK